MMDVIVFGTSILLPVLFPFIHIWLLSPSSKRLLIAAVITVIATPKGIRGEFKKGPNFLNSTPTSTAVERT
jgi:hypothetical protein